MLLARLLARKLIYRDRTVSAADPQIPANYIINGLCARVHFSRCRDCLLERGNENARAKRIAVCSRPIKSDITDCYANGIVPCSPSLWKRAYDTRWTISRQINDIFSSESEINESSWRNVDFGTFGRPVATISDDNTQRNVIISKILSPG